jgi:2-succinyl-5-enolpyruvyl-6-hydroxy-3-cyclohexene-1-carboxylate synthase
VLTPTGLDVARIALLYDAEYREISDVPSLRAALGEPPHGTTILHIRTERSANVALHRRCWEAVSAELSGNTR